MCPLAVSSQSANRPQQVQLVNVAFLVAVDFRETVQRLVGQRDRRHAIQHAPKDHPGLVTITPTMRQHTSQELGPDHHVEFATVGKFLENQLRLVIDLLSQERFADSKFGLDRLGRLGVPVLDRGEFVPGQVEPLRLGKIPRQQQLDLGLGLIIKLLALAVLDHPAPQDVLDPVMVLVAAGGNVTLAHKQHEIGRHLVTVLIEQRLVGVVCLDGQFLVTQSQ